MSRNCLVSVIIPAYNAESFIKECLNSTISQTYKNIEIIVVCKPSVDRTVDICREYEKKDDRIKVLEQSTKGVSEARNVGIAKAQGDYIVFFDTDDYPEPDIIESYIEAEEEWSSKNIAFIACGMFFDNELNKYVTPKKSILESGHGYIEGENYLVRRSTAATLSWLKLFNFVTNKCYDLKFIRENGIRFDEDVNIGEDLKFNLDCLDKCSGSIGMVNRPLYHYVKRSDRSLSLTYHKSDINDTKAIYRRFVEWESRQKGVTDENIQVVKGIYLTDWISRLTTLYEHFRRKGPKTRVRRILREEMNSHEFKQLLSEVHRARKISTFRYLCLKTGIYEVFYFFRGFYQLLKG